MARHGKIVLTNSPPPRSAPDKVKLAAAMKRVTLDSKGWLAERLQMGSAASVSQYVRRFHLAERATPEFQGALSIVQACPSDRPPKVGASHRWLAEHLRMGSPNSVRAWVNGVTRQNMQISA